MSDAKIRSVNTQLTRFSIAAFAVLAASLAVGAAAIDWSVSEFEAAAVTRRAAAVARLFARQADETERRVQEHAASREASELLLVTSPDRTRRLFADEMAHWLPRYGYTFIVLADSTGGARLSWTEKLGTGGAPPALPAALFTRLAALGASGGYLRLGDDVMLVGGAPMRRASAATSARPAGYLVIGMPVDSGHLSAWGQELATRLSISRAGSLVSDRETVTSFRGAGGDTLLVRQPLHDLFGAPLGVIDAAFDRHELRELFNFSVSGLVLALIVGAVTLGMVWNSGRRLLVTPVRAMAREVEAMRRSRALHEISGDAPAAEWQVLKTTFNETVRTLYDWQQRYRDVFDRAADALFIIEPSTGRVIDANPATTMLTGVPPETMIGQPLPADLWPGGSGQRVVRWRRPDGVTQTWGVAVSEIELDGGPWTLAAYRDLTGREAMAHAQKMEAVGSLAGGIAHDFNNLLGAVLTGTAAARALVGEGHPATVALDGIEHAGTRAAELTRQLLSFSRHDPLRLAPVDLGQAIETVGRICSRTFDRRIVVDAWAPSDLPAVLGDAGEVEQALLNLCINARDAMAEGGSLRLEAQREELDAEQARDVGVQPGTYVTVTVADTGAGMTDEVKARLFEPFFTTKEAGKGTGLGLSLVYGHMRQLGGAIAVRSAVGRGTRVTLHFPALAVRAERPVPPATPPSGARVRPSSPGASRPVVLLIDDERALREMLHLVLDLQGFEVLEAADGASGVARLRERRGEVCAVILDVQLPGELSGGETLTAIRALDADVPVLLCTGFVREDELARMRMLTVDDVLLKPVDVNTLLARLDVLAQAPRSVAAAAGAATAGAATTGAA
ncbi:MAG: ATP-binding response regulator [Gemmatimonadaceae bacterium]